VSLNALHLVNWGLAAAVLLVLLLGLAALGCLALQAALSERPRPRHRAMPSR
jgi:hypothetical protein